MNGPIFLSGLCLFVMATSVAGLLPQIWPGMTQSAAYAIALTVGVLVALAMAVVLSQDEGVNH